jgi:AcrR family transcriptional regulator
MQSVNIRSQPLSPPSLRRYAGRGPAPCARSHALTARRRLSPELRRDLILDAAAEIVAADGVSAASFEAVAARAGVSKALVYAYFQNRTTMLAALLRREYPAFRNAEPGPPDREHRFEDIIRATTRAYLSHVAEKGILLQRLLGEPAIAAAVAEAHAIGRDATAQWFGRQMAVEYGGDPEAAARLADVLMGVTGAAGARLYRDGGDVEAMTAFVTRILMAAVRSEAGR